MNEHNTKEQFVSLSLFVSGMGVLLVGLVGWVFNVIADNTQLMEEKQSKASVVTAVNSTRISSMERRVDKLESKK